MKRLTAVLMFLLLTLCESSFALNDREYYDMKKDPFFRASDKRLNKLIDDMKNILPDKDYNALRDSHKAWIESELDNTAGDLMANNKLAKVDAYVQSIENRIKYIESIKRQYTHEPEIEQDNNSIAKTDQDSQQEIKTQAQAQDTHSDSKTEAQQETLTQNQNQTQQEVTQETLTQNQKLTQNEAKELLERELKNRGLWQGNNVIVAGTDSEADSAGGETLTLYDEANNKEEECWHFIHGEDFPDYISAINDYYVSMNDGAVYVLDTFDDVVRPIDEAEL